MAAPSACSTRSTPGASAPRSSPAARSPPSVGGRATFALAGLLALLVFFIAFRTTSREEVHHGSQVVVNAPPLGLAA